MTIQYQDITQEQALTTSTTIYACPSYVESAHIQFGSTMNTDVDPYEITVNIVKSGESPDAGNTYFNKTLVPSRVTGLNNLVGMVLKPGDYISTIAEVNNVISVKMSVKEMF